MTGASSSLLDLLVEHGVPERGARLYLAACREGPQTASELARLAELNRVEAYRFIRQLESTGILRATGRRPMRFAAIPPAELVDRLIRTATERLGRLEANRDKFLNGWRESLKEFDHPNGRKFTVLEGRESIYRFLVRRLGTAEREVRIATSGFGLVPAIDGGLARALAATHRRGVRVRLVTDVSRANLGEAKHFSSFCDLRHSEEPVTNRAVVIDRSGVLVFVSGAEGLGSSGDSQVALWSTDPSFLKLASGYHERLWRRSVPAENRLVELEAPEAAVLPVVLGKEGESFQRLEEVAALGMRAAGIPELRLDLPDLIEAIARQMGRQIAGVVEGTTPHEVARSLADYYARHAMGKLAVVKEQPLTLRVTQCFACVRQSTEVGRVLCPSLLAAAFESRTGARCHVSKPDPRRHASRGCVFTVSPT